MKMLPRSALLLALLLPGCGGTPAPAPEAPLVAEATVRDMVIAVRGSGSIQSEDAHRVRPEISGNAVVSYLVPNGERVSQGQVVARLNTDELEAKIDELTARLDERRGLLESAVSELEIQNIDNAAQIKAAEQEVTSAEMKLEQFLEGDRPLRRRNASLKVKQSENDLKSFRKRHRELQALLEEDFVTEDEVEDAAQDVETAAINLESARIEERVLEEYDLVLDLAAAEIEVASARMEHEKTLKTTERLRRDKERAVAAAEREVKRVEDELAERREELEAYEVTAPAGGVVQYGEPERPWRNRDIQVGMTLPRGRVLVTIPDLSSLKAVVNVPESDVRRVEVGQEAVVTVEAMAGATYRGRVSKVAETANVEGRWGGSDVNEFAVEVSLGSVGELKPGFSCEAEIFCRTIKDVLQVPIQSVFRDEDTFLVYVRDGQGGTPREVTLGEATTTHVQITSGLKEGEEVFLARPAGQEQQS